MDDVWQFLPLVGFHAEGVTFLSARIAAQLCTLGKESPQHFSPEGLPMERKRRR
jgi:hypothetical protein